MSSFVKNLLYSWRYYSLGEATYKKCMERVFAYNLVGLRQANLITLILAFSFTFVPLLIARDYPRTWYYLATAVAATVFFIIADRKYKQRKQPSKPFIYAMIGLCFANVMQFGLYIGVFGNPGGRAVTFIGLYIAALVLFTIPPLVNLCLNTGVYIVFAVSSILLKTSDLWLSDIINALVAYVISLIIGWLMSKYRMGAALNSSELEDEVSAKNEYNRFLFENSPVGLTIFDDNFKYVDCNEAVLKIYGISREFYSSFFGSSAHSPEYQPDGSRSADKALEIVKRTIEGEDLRLEWTHLTPEGEPLPVDLTLTRMKQGDKYVGLGYLYDMREQIQAQNIIKYRTTMLDALNKMAVILLSRDDESFEDIMSKGLSVIADVIGFHRFSVWQNFERPDGLHTGQIYRWDLESGGTTKPIESLIDMTYDIHAPNWKKQLETGVSINTSANSLPEDSPEAVILKQYGVVSVYTTPLFYKGAFWGFGLFEDRRSERRFDEESTETMPSAAALCANMIIMNNREHALHEANRTKSEFLSRMSHEMRTPMNTIIGITQIAKITSDPRKRADCLIEIETASRELMRLIDDVLNVSDMDFGMFKLADFAFDFNAMIHEMLQNAANTSAAKKQSFTYDVDPMIPAVLIGDEKRLKQVIAGILGNAMKFTPEYGKINFDVNVIDNTDEAVTLQFLVSDNGSGIPKDKQKHVYELFYQADGSLTREHGGIGIGLSLAKRIIEMMGGAIDFVSETGTGTRFTFTCKLKTPTGDKKTDAPPDFSGKRILVVDDMATNRGVVRRLLASTGVEIVEAVNGKDAVDVFYESPDELDLILMDIMMPEMNGYEATKKIRASGLREDIPIVALTALTKESDIDEAKKAGMDSHIGKPTEARTLLTVLNRFLAEAAAH